MVAYCVRRALPGNVDRRDRLSGALAVPDIIPRARYLLHDRGRIRTFLSSRYSYSLPWYHR